MVNVALVVRRSVWNYPFALAMVSLYFLIFLEARLYSDALLQLFFFAREPLRLVELDRGEARGGARCRSRR